MANDQETADQNRTTSHIRTLTDDDWRWWTCVDGRAVSVYDPSKFERFLVAAGYRDGRLGERPELPEWAVDETPEQHRVWRKRGIPPEITYFALGEWTGRVKIGFTTQRPRTRVSQLQYGENGEPATLIAIRRGEHFEKLYHRAFYTWAVGNEWFAPHPDILVEAEWLAGQFGTDI